MKLPENNIEKRDIFYEIMDLSGLSRRELAGRLGISYSYLSKILGHTKPVSHGVYRRALFILGQITEEIKKTYDDYKDQAQ